MRELEGARVLLVEDEPLIAMHVEDVLVGLGCHIAGVASSNEQARSIVESATIDIAVLDINLGNNQTSYATADLLSERAVPYILLSGYSRTGQRSEDEARPWLQKPVDEGELSRALLFALQHDRANRAPD